MSTGRRPLRATLNVRSLCGGCNGQGFVTICGDDQDCYVCKGTGWITRQVPYEATPSDEDLGRDAIGEVLREAGLGD